MINLILKPTKTKKLHIEKIIYFNTDTDLSCKVVTRTINKAEFFITETKNLNAESYLQLFVNNELISGKCELVKGNTNRVIVKMVDTEK